MLYELIGIARPGTANEVRDIVFTTGQSILRSGGVIRSVANWGVFSLPRPVAKHHVKYLRGHYFVLRFDSTIAAQRTTRATLALDPRVIRTACVRLGDGKLETTARYGPILWSQAFDRS